MLDNTGSGAALTVTGDATTTRNTSGGTISSVTGADGATDGNGIYLSNTGAGEHRTDARDRSQTTASSPAASTA